MTYVPDPILAEVLGPLDAEKRERFADALIEAICSVATAKAEALGAILWKADVGPMIESDRGHPWQVSWYVQPYDNGPIEPMECILVTLDEVMHGTDVDKIRAEREAREAEEARRVAEARAKQEALKASGRAKIVAADLTLEEQVALGFRAFYVK